jgi:hypothetical protein
MTAEERARPDASRARVLPDLRWLGWLLCGLSAAVVGCALVLVARWCA